MTELTTQFRGQRFRLELTDSGEPKCLKREVQADSGRFYWATVFDWHS
jgi:hypothetical protein